MFFFRSSLIALLVFTAACSDGTDAETDNSRNFLAGGASVRHCQLAAEFKDTNYLANSPVRNDIRADRHGLFVYYKLRIVNVNDRCRPLPYARVEIWHADVEGNYSTTGSGYLRGQQQTDQFGVAQFISIFPGWHYQSSDASSGKRAHHVNIRISNDNKLISDTEFYFEDDMVESIYSLMSPYKDRIDQNSSSSHSAQTQNWIGNSRDMNVRQASESAPLIKLEQFRQGYKGELTIGVAL